MASLLSIAPYAQGFVLATILATTGYGISKQKDIYTQNLVESGSDINGNGSLEISEAVGLINQKFTGEDGVLSDTAYKAALQYGDEMFKFDQSNYQRALTLIRLSQQLKQPLSEVETMLNSVEPQTNRGRILKP